MKKSELFWNLNLKKRVQDIISKKTVLPRAILRKLESVTAIDLRIFGDISILANYAAACTSSLPAKYY